MAKAWLQKRWETLLPALERLTADQEEEIARICAEEIETWKSRPSMKSPSSLKEPMSDTRNAIRKLPLTKNNTWLNPKTNQREHIALKHMNYSESEWAGMEKQSEDRLQKRMESQQIIDQPAEIVAKARTLLSSSAWPEVVVALSICTGRRLSEILKVGELHPRTLYTVVFSGELKRADAVLKPYEIPVLAPAPEVLAAWSRLRKMIDCSQMEVEAIGKAYSNEVAAAADRHFADLVPVREGRSGLYAHLFRAVYPRIAVYWFCPVTVTDIFYVPTVLGHYWTAGADETARRNYMSTLHYYDYRIGDGAGNIDGRQGIRLGEHGVEVLSEFQPKPASVKTGSQRRKEQKTMVRVETKKDHSLIRVDQDTKARFDPIHQDLGKRTENETVSVLLDDHFLLEQVGTLLSPFYGQLGVDHPQAAVEMLAGLLVDAAQDAEGKVDAEKKPFTAYGYLQSLITAKRQFLKSYEKRGINKDFSKMSLTQLRNTKLPGAAEERFRRAVDAIMAYNDQAGAPEMMWFVNAAVVTDLVGGRPGDAKEYLLSERDEEIKAHHAKYGLTPGFNRRAIKITSRVTVPEEAALEAPATEEAALVEAESSPAEE